MFLQQNYFKQSPILRQKIWRVRQLRLEHVTIAFSKAAGEHSNITGQTASAQVFFYLNVQLFATIVSIQGIWGVGGTVFLTLIISHWQKKSDAKVVYSISRRQKWNSRRQFSKNCIFQIFN